MLDHSLRSVSFIADIGDVLVLMARQQSEERANKEVLKPSQILASVGTAQTDHKNVKITCHVFQAPEVSPKYIIYLQRCFMKKPSYKETRFESFVALFLIVGFFATWKT